MSDNPSPEPVRRAFSLTIDGRDVLAGAGAVLVLGGSCAIHWALAVMVAGVSLLALAYRLSR